MPQLVVVKTGTGASVYCGVDLHSRLYSRGELK
jgi:hypothetical protein